MSDEEHVSEADETEEVSAPTGVSVELENHEYKNWVKGAKALDYLQQGLAPFVDRQIVLQYSILKNKLPIHNSACGCDLKNILPDHGTTSCPGKGCLCKQKGRRKCPNNGYCSTMCQLIISEHKHRDPLWKNTNITDWPLDHWSIAKCFMTTKCPSRSAQTTDAAGLLSVIINANFFNQCVTRPVGQQATDTFSKAREIRNEIIHKGRQQLTDHELQSLFDTFIAVLTDQAALSQDQDATRAVANLESLKKGQINISVAEEEEILNKRQLARLKFKQMEEEKKLAEQREAIAKENHAESIEKGRKDLRQKLAALFETHHIKTSVCPLKANENDFDIHDVYVTPNLTKEIKETPLHGSINLKQKSVNDISEIFKSEGIPPRAIYILGEVGSGKSAICKELMYKWCQSVDSRADTPNKITEFEFLFYLPLRNFHGNDRVKQMIYSDYGHMVSKQVLDDVFQRTSDKCLIILDGLDEWFPPATNVHAGHVTFGLPDSRDLHHATIVTTSRPSAPGVLNMKSSEYDQKIYINGVKKIDLKEIVGKYVSKMGQQSKQSESTSSILKELGDLKFGEIEKTPMLLQQIIWLLNEGYEVGNSVSAVYNTMLNIALRWLEKKSQEENTQRKCHDLKHEIPELIKQICSVCSYHYHIYIMSDIAFDLMTNECNSKPMIGRNYLQEKGISEDVIKDVLEIGLITKELCNDPTQESTHYTFVHQSFLEYFAALHVASHHRGTEASSVNHVTTLFRSCKTVQDVLQIEKVFVLISGLAPHMICGVFADIYQIAKNDKQYLSEREQVLKVTSPNLSSKQCAVQALLVRCLSVGHCDTISGKQVSLLDLMLYPTVNQDVMKERRLLFNYVDPTKVLQLHISSTKEKNVHYSKQFSSVLQKIDQLKILQTIKISMVVISHDELAKLSAYISSKESLTGIWLEAIECVDHRDCKHEINLSHNIKLKILKISDMKVFYISNINTTHIECCITDQEDIVRKMERAQHLKEIQFSCSNLKPHEIVNILKQNISLTKINMTTEEEKKTPRHAVIDLSGHRELRHWAVTDVSALHVTKLNTSNLEYCGTDNTDLISLLSNSPKLEQLDIFGTFYGTMTKLNNNICRVLNTLSQLHKLCVCNADIEDNALRMAPGMINLSVVKLDKVRMSLPTWHTFVDSLLPLKQTVLVYKSPADLKVKNYVKNYGEKLEVRDDNTNSFSFVKITQID